MRRRWLIALLVSMGIPQVAQAAGNVGGGSSVPAGAAHVRRGVAGRIVTARAASTIDVFYDFKGGSGDGSVPNTAFISDSSGALYVTTNGGGPSKDGTVVKLTPSGKGYQEAVLHAFSGPDGASPQGTLLLGSHGVIYGTTAAGGDPVCRCGTLFSLTPQKKKKGKYTYALLYRFLGGSDGATPMAGLIEDSNGILYGTTEMGGPYGWGTVFEYDATPSGVGYQQLVALFNAPEHDYIGYYPVAPLLLWNYQGTTFLLGATTSAGYQGGGSLFAAYQQPSGGWTAIPLTYFGCSGCGTYPASAPIQVGHNPDTFAGVTEYGGDPSCNCGVVYLATPAQNNTVTVLHTFTSANQDGKYPVGSLTADQNGALLGATMAGGTHNAGTAYQISYLGSPVSENIFFDFGGSAGSTPLSGFLENGSSALFGTASQGGSHSSGTAYMFPAAP